MCFENVDTSDDKQLTFEEFMQFCKQIGISDKESILVLFEGIDSD